MAATFVVPPGRDTEMMDKYGLGGIAVVDDLVFTGGMAIDLRTLKRPEEADTIAAETRLCFEGVERNLAHVGCTLRDVAKITCYVEEDSDRAEMREAVEEIFAPGPYPKQVTLVAGIGGDCRVEFEVLAVKPGA
jgi:2-iminobutanoate/2-iminopropanoate deaminase